jgi:hypothetical protein
MIDEREVDLLTLGEAVAGHLEGWTLDREATLKWHTPPLWAVLKDGDGREIHLDGRPGMGPRGKLRVSGSYPTAPGYMEYRPTINVGRSRAPSAIARDILRRFLPEYLTAHSLSVAEHVQEKARVARVADIRQRLADALGGTVGNNGSGPRVWGNVPAVRVDYVTDTSVKMEFRLAPDLAVKLAEWARENCPEDDD